MLRHLGRPAARTALVVTAAGLGLPLLCSLPASSTPLDPGLYLFHGVFDGPLCSAPAALPGRPAWSEVTCRVGGDEFFVPAGVTVLQVDVLGAAGGAGAQGAAGGGGAEIRASIMVSPGEMLEMAVGGVGGNGNEMGGFNGGGDGPMPSRLRHRPARTSRAAAAARATFASAKRGCGTASFLPPVVVAAVAGKRAAEAGPAVRRVRPARLVGLAACQPRAPATARVEGLDLPPGAPGTPPPCPVVPAAKARFPPEPQAAMAGVAAVATASAGVGLEAPAPPVAGAGAEAAQTSSTRSSSARASPSGTLMA